MVEVNLGVGDGDVDEREWVSDSRADYHMSGDITLFDKLEKHFFELFRQANQRKGPSRSTGSGSFVHSQRKW